jgi:hypothetical protein
MSSSPDELQLFLRRFRRRLRLCDGWLLAQRALWIVALTVLSVVLAARLWPVENVWLWASLPSAIWLLAVVGYSAFRFQPLLRTARRVDLVLGLKERLSTAVGINPDNPTSNLLISPELLFRQHADALAVARAIQPRRAFPLRWLRRPLLVAAVVFTLTAVLTVLPNPMDAVRAERKAVAQAAKVQAEKVEELKKEIAEAKEISPEERDKLLRALDELARSLRKQLRENKGDRAEALADLSKMEQSLRERLEPNAAARQAALEALSAQLQSLAGQQSVNKEDLAAAAEALQNLAEQLAEMNLAEQQALAQALAQAAARAARAGDMALAQALTQMAAAAQSGDSQQASQSAQSAADALSQAQSDLAAQAALQQTLSQVQNSRQAIARAGTSQQRAQGSSGTGMQGSNGTGTQGSQGQSQGNQPGSGGGSKADTLPPFTGSGQYRGQPQGQGNDSGVTPLGSQVYVPWDRLQGNDTLSISGQDTGQGETQSRETTDPLPGSLNPVLVPYQAAYYDYLNIASQTIEQSYIPAGLKDYVREYFSQLEP